MKSAAGGISRAIVTAVLFAAPAMSQEELAHEPAASTVSVSPASAALLTKDLVYQENFSRPARRNFYRWSIAAVAAGHAADAFSSWNQPESNRFLAPSSGNFSAQSLAIKAGFIGASFMIQRVALRRNPKLYRQFGWLNFAVAGGLGAAAVHNINIR